MESRDPEAKKKERKRKGNYKIDFVLNDRGIDRTFMEQ